MRGFLLALQFLTVIPAATKMRPEKKDFSRALVFFPFIGLLLGLILAGFNSVLAYFFGQQLLINTAVVILFVLLTGGLHYDGLADTFDALGSGKDKAEMLRIMREPSIGTMGVLSVLSVFALQIGLLQSLEPSFKNSALVLMCVVSRYSLVLSMALFSYARQEGKASGFMEAVSMPAVIAATVAGSALAFLFMKELGLFVFTLTALLTFLWGSFITRRIGGITGDTMGAASTLAEVFVLFVVVLSAS